MARLRIALGLGLVMLALQMGKHHWLPSLIVGVVGMVCLMFP